ncbi:MAG: hypothetical protein ACOYON_15030 [Fimbriimonas sp.]
MWDRCMVPVDGEPVRRELYATWTDPRRDSLEVRRSVLDAVVRQASLLKPPPVSSVEVHAVVPANLAPENKVTLEAPLPAARAKVVIRRLYSSEEDFAACQRFEEALEAKFEGSPIGYVDGNEVGDGEYDIYLYGPRKAPLVEAVEDAIRGAVGWSIWKGRRSR